MHGVFAKCGVRVCVPHHVGHFLSIFGSVYDYRGSTFSAGSMMMELSFFSVCVAILSLPLADVRFRDFSSFDGTFNLPSEFFCRGLCHVFRD